METRASIMFVVTWLNYHKRLVRGRNGEKDLEPTIARGNCSNMKREIDGKILSEVSGASEVKAAVAKELKATSTTRD